MKALAERIKELMEKRNMTQKKLAATINVTEAAMSRYLKGERIPRLDVVANLATALMTTSDYLLGNETADNDEFDFSKVKRILARHANEFSAQQKNDLIAAILSERNK